MRKNCSRSIQNGSSRDPANTRIPVGDPSTVLTGPVTLGSPVRRVFDGPVSFGRAGPRTVTTWLPAGPVNVAWMTRSSSASPVLSILIW
jgi:hypothetical protein